MSIWRRGGNGACPDKTRTTPTGSEWSLRHDIRTVVSLEREKTHSLRPWVRAQSECKALTHLGIFNCPRSYRLARGDNSPYSVARSRSDSCGDPC